MSDTWGLSFEDVDAALAYDADTGKIWWKIRPARNIMVGSEAGAVKATRTNKNGAVSYRYIRLNGATIPAARIAWLLHHGEWPLSRIKFKDGDTLNLAASNLEIGENAMASFERREARREYNTDYLRASREAFAPAWKDRDLQARFGISLAQYGEMLVAKGGVCAICANKETATRDGVLKALAVDHDHATGAVRGLLCSDCNTGIGKLKDSPATLRAAADYIERHAAKVVNLDLRRAAQDGDTG